MREERNFWRGKRVFVTGHTGFKGTWLAKMLTLLGAEVTGYALRPLTEEGQRVYEQLELGTLSDIDGDIRDFEKLSQAVRAARPEIVLHLAAQPLVLESYRSPRMTYETNVMGTVNILESIRRSGGVRSFLNVTTDKVYHNREWCWGYSENEPLDGFDPYSNSKSCSELVTHSYQSSFFSDGETAISTARAGNVIGGGDFSANRILPDCIRAASRGERIEVRNPNSTRPYQHVLEPLAAYLMIARRQYEDHSYAGWYNVGPDDCDCVTTGDLATLFCKAWGDGASWETKHLDAPHEANFLKLDSTKLKTTFGWQPRWHIGTAIEKTVEWAKAWQQGIPAGKIMERQIKEVLERETTDDETGNA